MGAATALEIKFEGVPCQEMGRVVASSARYLIALLVLTMSNKNRCLGSAGGELKRSRTKGSDGSDGLCQNVSFTPRSYLPIQPNIDEHFNILSQLGLSNQSVPQRPFLVCSRTTASGVLH